MGNHLEISFLDKPVVPDLLILTRFNGYSGSSIKISKLFQNFLSIQQSSSFYIHRGQFKIISRDTPISGFEDIVLPYFSSTVHKVNIMEILSAITTYSLSN